MKSTKPRELNIDGMGGDLGSIAQKLTSSRQNGVMLDTSIMPSRGKFYKNPIYIKKLSIPNIKNLSTMTEENINQVLNTVISQCIDGIPCNEIMLGDKLWLIYYLREFTYPQHKHQISYNCPKCKNAEIYNFNIDDMVITYFDENDYDVQVKLPISEKVITTKFPTIRDEMEVYQRSNGDIVEKIDKELLQIAEYIDEIDGKKVSLRNAYETVLNLDPVDFSLFGNYMGERNFGLKPIVQIPCPCGEKIDKIVKLSPDFFMPKNIK